MLTLCETLASFIKQYIRPDRPSLRNYWRKRPSLFLVFSSISIQHTVGTSSTLLVIILFACLLVHLWRILTWVSYLHCNHSWLWFHVMIMIGIDAMERVLKKAKKAGMKEFGQGWVVNIWSGALQRTFSHSYKTTGEVPDSPVQVAWFPPK